MHLLELARRCPPPESIYRQFSLPHELGGHFIQRRVGLGRDDFA